MGHEHSETIQDRTSKRWGNVYGREVNKGLTLPLEDASYDTVQDAENVAKIRSKMHPEYKEQKPAGGMSVGLRGMDRAANARMLRDKAQEKSLKEGGEMAPWEHGQVAQGMTEAGGLPAALMLLGAIPGYQAYKGVQQAMPANIGKYMYGAGATPPSFVEAAEAYKGMWTALLEEARTKVMADQFRRGFADGGKAIQAGMR